MNGLVAGDNALDVGARPSLAQRESFCHLWRILKDVDTDPSSISIRDPLKVVCCCRPRCGADELLSCHTVPTGRPFTPKLWYWPRASLRDVPRKVVRSSSTMQSLPRSFALVTLSHIWTQRSLFAVTNTVGFFGISSNVGSSSPLVMMLSWKRSAFFLRHTTNTKVHVISRRGTRPCISTHCLRSSWLLG